MSKAQSGFSFSEGDDVLVRVREHGTSGDIVAKFSGTCVGIEGRPGPSSPAARISLSFGTMNSVTLRPYEAEFEEVDG